MYICLVVSMLNCNARYHRVNFHPLPKFTFGLQLAHFDTVKSAGALKPLKPVRENQRANLDKLMLSLYVSHCSAEPKII